MLLHKIVDGDNEILTKLVDQQQQILDLLKKVVTNTTSQFNPEPTTTGEMIMRNTHDHQQSTDHDFSTLEELLNTTTDEELDFLDSPSWNSPHFSGINASNVQIPAANSIQSPPVHSTAQTLCNVNPTVQTPYVNPMYQLPSRINPAVQIPVSESQARSGVNPPTQQYPQPSSTDPSPSWQNKSVPASLQARSGVNPQTQQYPQPSSIEPSPSWQNESVLASVQARSGVNPPTQQYPQPSSTDPSPSWQNESVPASLVPPPFSTPPKLLQVDDVMKDYPGNDVFTLRRLATALARDAIFGKKALSKSSLSGKNNTGCLEKRKLEYIKTIVRSRVPTMSDVAFEALWGKCRSSLSKSCQTLRVAAKKKLLT